MAYAALSFVIPAYNAETTIQQCLDSILQQDHANIPFEVIIINDGSTDQTESILQEYADNKEVQVISTSNHGVSHARNLGIEKATGDYFAFIDGDDWIADDYFKQLAPILGKKPDMICGRYQRTSSNDSEKRLDLTSGVISLHDHAGIKDFLFGDLEQMINGTLSNKVYKNSIIQEHNIRFIEGKTMSEDWMFNAEYLEYIDEIETLSSVLFYYRVNQSSVTENYNPHYVEDMISFIEEIQHLSEKVGYECPREDLTLFYLNRWFGVCHNEARGESFDEGWNQFSNYLEQPFFQENLPRVKGKTWKQKIYRFLTLFHLSKVIYTIEYKRNH